MLPGKAIAFVVMGFLSTAPCGEDAAPSSHFVYDDASFEGDILVNEVRVPKDGEALYTYYEALGWGGLAAGYAGIQSHPKGRNYLFSIWDHPKHTAPIQVVYRNPGTLTEKFGGEGTGMKSWNFELGWETDTWYTLVSRCWPVRDHTFFGFWTLSAKTGQWTHLVTMDVAAKEAWFHGGNDSFIEDWLETGKVPRTIHLRRGWKRKTDGPWHAFATARYSVNSWDLTEGKRSFNFRTNWDGGVATDTEGPYYFMIAGGADTKPSTTNPSSFAIPRTEKEPDFAPIGILSTQAQWVAPGKIRVTWAQDSRTLPQFRFVLSAHSDKGGTSPALAEVSQIEPHARSAELECPDPIAPGKLFLYLRVVDILDRESAAVPVAWPSGN